MLALVDDKYCFSYVDIGTNGRASDGGVFARSSLGQALESHSLSIPEPSVIVGLTPDELNRVQIAVVW